MHEQPKTTAGRARARRRATHRVEQDGGAQQLPLAERSASTPDNDPPNPEVTESDAEHPRTRPSGKPDLAHCFLQEAEQNQIVKIENPAKEREEK